MIILWTNNLNIFRDVGPFIGTQGVRIKHNDKIMAYLKKESKWILI